MRTKTAAIVLAACALFVGKIADAHRIDEYLQATMLSLETHRLQASMRLVPGILVSSSVIASIDNNGDGVFSEDEQRAYAQHVLGDLSISVDGRNVRAKLGSWNFPQPAQMRGGLGEIHIDYTIDLPPGGQDRSLIIENHHQSRTSVYLMNVLLPQDVGIRIVAQKRNEQQSFYELDYHQAAAIGAGPRTSWDNVRAWLDGVQFSRLFHLGMHHIAEGTDHLLFLLVLLLPAPILASGLRWGPSAGIRRSLIRILGIVTAFTAGHSITLTLAALGAISVPSHPVEVLIAVSIFISAVHAFRPIFPGKEAWIAAFFGLIHGLAFAATLDRLGLGRWERTAGILAFNLGIETMQLLIVAAVLPSLILLSRTRAYPILRIGGSVFAATASLGWIIERLLDVDVGVDRIVDTFARHGPLISVTLFLLSFATYYVVEKRGHLSLGALDSRRSHS